MNTFGVAGPDAGVQKRLDGHDPALSPIFGLASVLPGVSR